MKQKFRKGFELELRSTISNVLRSQYDNYYPFQSCLNCTYFKEETEICTLANQRPPAKIIVYGCPMYEDQNEIPF